MMDFFSIDNVMMTIPIGKGGYALSWLEAVVTITGLLCIWLASKEKIINYLFGIITVTLASAIFFQIQLYASLLLQIFFFVANWYGWYAWSRQNESHEVALKIRWLPRRKAIMLSAVCVVAIAFLTMFIDPVFAELTRIAVDIMQGMGMAVTMPHLEPDAFPLWDSTILVLSIAAMVLMTRKYVENWLLWVAIDIISIVLFTIQGVYVLALENVLLTVIAGMGALAWMKSAKLSHSKPLQ